MQLDEIAKLAERIVERSAGKNRFMIAVAGPPGAGKSYLAEKLCRNLKRMSYKAKIVPMDGYHLDNAVLERRGLLQRKGAPTTFDVAGFLHLMKRLAAGEDNVAVPTFDRIRDIAIAGSEVISTEDKFLIVEGNYLLLRDSPWSDLQAIWDEAVFLCPAEKVLENRLIQRWVDHGMAWQAAHERAASNDIPNAKLVIERSDTSNTLPSMTRPAPGR